MLLTIQTLQPKVRPILRLVFVHCATERLLPDRFHAEQNQGCQKVAQNGVFAFTFPDLHAFYFSF